jgi:hypothetical protein
MLTSMMSTLRPRNRVELACAVLAPPAYTLVKGAMSLWPTKSPSPEPLAGEVIDLGDRLGSAAD